MKEQLLVFLKKLLSNGLLALLIIAILYIIFLRECKKTEPCPADNEVIVPKNVWDEIQALANKPAVTHIDTVYIKGVTVYVDKPIPIPVHDKDTTVLIYNDTLKRKDIDVSYTLKVRGVMLNRKWSYNPIITEVFRTDTIYVPKLIDKPYKVPASGLFGYFTAGGNANSFIFGGGLDFITKKNTELGYMYQRFGASNIHSFKLGVKLFQ